VGEVPLSLDARKRRELGYTFIMDAGLSSHHRLLSTCDLHPWEESSSQAVFMSNSKDQNFYWCPNHLQFTL
jgi:hypothetical protein